MPILWSSCEPESYSRFVEEEEENQYMQLALLRSGGKDNESDKPCFIFWKETNYLAPGFSSNPTTPYVYCHPDGVIDDYNVTKYNTRYVYPDYSEWVHAVGIAPGALVPKNNTTGWTEFYIPETDAGLIEIQCAPVVRGNQQLPFSDPLKFAHQLTKLEIHAYCGDSMMESENKYINVKDIKISISSDDDNQWKRFPEKLIWNGENTTGQYIVKGYDAAPSSEIVAEISSDKILLGKTDTSKDAAKVIGNFYLVPGFNTITIRVEATYIDTTNDDTITGNGQVISRKWDKVTVKEIYPESGPTGTKTSAGESYELKLSFDRSKIELSATLEDWRTEIHN